MSYIKGNTTCSICKENYSYYWLYPDTEFERIPHNLQVANHNKCGNYYEVLPKCPKCNSVNVVNYSLTGKEIYSDEVFGLTNNENY